MTTAITRTKVLRPRAPWLLAPTTFIVLTFAILIVATITTHTPYLSLRTLSSAFTTESVYRAAPDSLYHAWERTNETCTAWIQTQRNATAYIDAYVVGSQKAGTTQLTHMLEALQVRRKSMIKEWHFYNHLTAEGTISFGRFEADPLPPLDKLDTLRLMHYRLGFPKLNVSTLPPIDDSPIDNRTLVLDSTVEYLHMERAAILAKKLTPHSRIVMMMRDPPLRALSQYNMLRRNNNRKLRAKGMSDRPASPEEFDEKVRAEIEVLRKCGYDDVKATIRTNTTKLIRCMRFSRPRIDDVMYVLRGLYFLFIPAWRENFPDHRILFVSFSDLAKGNAESYQRIARFFCIKPFTEKIIKSIEKEKGSELSHGARAARDGLTKVGPDSYHGNDRYLPTMLPSTQRLLDTFYRPANKRLTKMIGRPMF